MSTQYNTGDKVVITCGLSITDAKYVGVVGEYEFTTQDNMAYVSVKAKGQRVARSICVNPRTMLKAA